MVHNEVNYLEKGWSDNDRQIDNDEIKYFSSKIGYLRLIAIL